MERVRWWNEQRKANSGVAISLDAAELEGLSEAELRARYAAAGPRGTHEDLSDVVNEEGKRRKLGSFSLLLLLFFPSSLSFLSVVEVIRFFY
jgi:hypothetical protein